MTSKNTKKRIAYLDICKAFAVMFVVIGHLLPHNYLFHLITGPIKMPVFYIISGYFFNSTSKNFHKKTIKLLIPFFICSLLYFAIVDNNLRSFADQLLYGKNYLWFIPSFILTQIIFRVLFKVIKNKKILAVLAIILLCLGAILHQYRPFNALCLDTALTGVFFYYIGFIYKDIEKGRLLSNRKIVFVTSALTYALCLVLSYLLFKGETIDFHNCYYYNLPLCVALILAESLASFCVFKHFGESKICKPLLLIGENSLFIYLFHPIAFKLVDMSGISTSIGYGGTLLAIKFIIACISGLAISLLYKRLAVLFAKRRSSSNNERH